ncbi:MAG: 50S ribosomal protein L4 [Kiritimatiellia bacterium]
MSSIKLYKTTGEAGGHVAVDDAMLVLDRGGQAVKDVVVATQNARRAGTASTLSKGEVAGSNKKPWKQKGTGRARAGLRQSPVWRGGAVAFGPRPRSFETKINRKVGQLAYRHALSERIQDGGLIAIESFDLAEAKTRVLAALLRKLGITRGCLIVVDQPDVKLVRATHNIPKVAVVRAADVGVYDLVRYRTVLTTRAGLAVLTARLAKKAEVAA